MIRQLLLCVALVLWAGGLAAQSDSGRARLDPAASVLADAGFGGARMTLGLSQGVPWRIFTLTDPNRVVIDFRTVDWSTADPSAMKQGKRFSSLRMGPYRGGWTRLVAEMATPMVVDSAGMDIDENTGRATLEVELVRAEQSLLDALSGAPDDGLETLPVPTVIRPEGTVRDRPLVVLDPGHGGIDPGAERDGIKEADLMLAFARDLAEVLIRSGYDVALTRQEDVFVSLDARVAKAQALEADLFLSLHADALAEGVAHGAAIYTLSDKASDKADAALAERHDRGDLLAGVDLSAADDEVTGILLDLVRLDNQPRSEALARHLIDGIGASGGAVHKRPLRQAGFSVLRAAGIPSVLVEVGFLSTDTDLNRLRDPVWRALIAEGLRDGIDAWALEDAALSRLRRQ